ncbi:ribokinase [Photobacterium satsumensis]|uniref:ribokinase n=1 Tax=Photobacterium satsumensis TaxID=2910239 RepID=UPI003D0BFC50
MKKSKSSGAVFVFGSYNADIVSYVRMFPKHGQTVTADSTKILSGGKGANQAIACRRLCSDTHFFVKVGNDEFGSKAEEILKNNDFAGLYLNRSHSRKTGTASIISSLKDRDNMIAIDLGANCTVTPEEIDAVEGVIRQSAVVLTQLENNLDAISQVIQLGSESGCKTILNPAPYHPKAKQLLCWANIVTPNETEASSLSGIEVVDIESATSAAQAIRDMGAKVVIITLGSNGCLLHTHEGTTHYPAYPCHVTDTSGAGDSFNGALAASLAANQPIEEAVNFANAFAACATEKLGASNMPTLDEVNTKLASMTRNIK